MTKNERQAKYVAKHKDKIRERERELDKKRRRADPRKTMVDNARRRSRQQKVPFSISYKDLVIPDVCPVLGIPLFISDGKRSDNSPSLDKFIPEIGYVLGNIHVISAKANQLKSNGTIEEVTLLLKWMLKTKRR